MMGISMGKPFFCGGLMSVTLLEFLMVLWGTLNNLKCLMELLVFLRGTRINTMGRNFSELLLLCGGR